MRETDVDAADCPGDAPGTESGTREVRGIYGAPVLREYGAVARRTMAVSVAGMLDSVNPATMMNMM